MKHSFKVNIETALLGNNDCGVAVSFEDVTFEIKEREFPRREILLFDKFGSKVQLDRSLVPLFQEIYTQSVAQTRVLQLLRYGEPVGFTCNTKLPYASNLAKFLQPFLECEHIYRERPELTLIVKDI